MVRPRALSPAMHYEPFPACAPLSFIRNCRLFLLGSSLGEPISVHIHYKVQPAVVHSTYRRNCRQVHGSLLSERMESTSKIYSRVAILYFRVLDQTNQNRVIAAGNQGLRCALKNGECVGQNRDAEVSLPEPSAGKFIFAFGRKAPSQGFMLSP